MSKVVLDASAVLAVLLVEPGGDVVADRLAQSHISVVNLTEVVTKLIDKGYGLDKARRTLDMLANAVEEVDEAQAYAAASLRSATRKSGLSVGDRYCLSLAARLGAPVITTDKNWAKLDVGVEVIVAR